MSDSNNFSRAEFLSRHSDSQVRQFGQEIEVSIYDDIADSVLVLYDQIVELLNQKDYYFAMDLCFIEIQNLKESLGVNSPDSLISVYTILANIFFEIGHYEDAAKFLSGTLSLQEMKYGVNNPLVANTLNNLAVVLAKEGKDEEVEKLAKRALGIYDQTMVIEDSNTVRSIVKKLNELALYFNKRSEYSEQERCCSRAVKICERNLSPNDAEIATATIYLAVCYAERQKYKKAEEMFKKVVSTAYENEFGNMDNKSKWLQKLAPMKIFGLNKDKSNPIPMNIWQVAEQREKNKGTLHREEAHSLWYKPANFDSTTFNLALCGLQVLYNAQGKSIASDTLKLFLEQQRTNIADVTEDVQLQNSNDLSTSLISFTSELPPPLSINRQELVSGTDLNNLPTSSAPPLIELLQSVPSKKPQIVSRVNLPKPPPPPPPKPRRETPSLEKVVAELQAEIAEKARQLEEAQRTIQTHGAFCSICLTEVANRMWSGCNHLAACDECAESYSDTVTDENRSRNGIACPKCRTHGYPLPAFI